MSMLDRLAQLSPRKLAFLVLDLQGKLDAAERTRTEPIAIVGMGCRFPGGADTPARYWDLLRDGRSAVTEIPSSRWNIADYYDPDPDAAGRMYVRHGGFLGDVAGFDAGFFGISPREAESLDPQHRLLLETAWEALEDAGQAPRSLAGSKSGVFVGISASDYAQIVAAAGASHADAYMMTGNALNFAAGRLSYVLGLQGPCMAVDTACSSSLTAVHLACRSLRAGDSDLALAGGVNLMLRPEGTILASRARMLSASGSCRTFDAAAEGIVRAEGCGVVVLKRLSTATTAGDRILAVIRGSAINQDGPSSGITVPNGRAQQTLIREALRDAGVEPQEISYVEAHGTGTRLGDPIEVRALTTVLAEGRTNEQPLLLGSVKTNIGHAESAAGIAGLIKVVLAMQHGQIPPHLHLQRLNPDISLPPTVSVATTLTAWTAPQRIAGVSSFGASGTNVHVVLGEHRPEPDGPDVPDRPLHVLALSARSEQALSDLTGRYVAHLAADSSLADMCFTANAGRAHFPHRLAVVASSPGELRERLATLGTGDHPSVVRGEAESVAPRLAFLFTGQGAQYAGMGRELYETQPAFRRTIDRCSEILSSELEYPLSSALYPASANESRIDETAYTQPALFAVEYALAELWRSWGVTPTAVLGHSVGEYVAACVAGVFSLEDGLKLVAARGRLMQRLTASGAMAAVSADERTVSAAIGSEPDVAIAALNGPTHTVISGDRAAIERLTTQFDGLGIRCQRLTVSHAFHSPLMDPMLDEFDRIVSGVTLQPPALTIVPNLTGNPADAALLTTAQYWRDHIRRPVQFARGMRALADQRIDIFLEVGPAPTLLGMGARCLDQSSALWSPSLRRGRGDWSQMLDTLARLYTRGVAVDWASFDGDYRRRRVSLPTYPFQRERHWVKGVTAAEPVPAPAAGPAGRALVKNGNVGEWFYAPSWQRVPLPQTRASDRDAASPADWLVFLDDCGVANRVVERLETLGHRVATVRPGAAFDRDDSGRFVVDPVARGDYRRMLGALSAAGRMPAHLLHCWGVGGDAGEPDERAWGPREEAPFNSLLCLAQALAEIPLPSGVRIGVVTSGLYDVTGEEELSPHKGLMLGPCRVVGQEHPQIACTNIDLGASELDAWTQAPAAVIDALLADATGQPGDAAVAYRHGRRWRQRFEPVPMRDPAEANALRKGGIYMLTGGLGDIALHLAESLASSWQARLVLTTRSPFPPEEQWDGLLAAPDREELTVRRIARLRQIGAAGGEVLVVQADVCDDEQMRAAFDRADERFGAVHGVIHAAGVLDEHGNRALLDTDEGAWRHHLAPKVHGVRVLERIVRERDLDFCLLVSSLSTVLGGLGHAAYAAANAYLDVFAHRQDRTSRCAWVAVDLDSWERGVQDGRPGLGDAPRPGLAMTSAEGVLAFRHILATRIGPQIIVSTAPLSARLERWVNAPVRQALEPARAAVNSEATLTPDDLLGLEPDARAARLTTWLSGRAARALGITAARFSRNQPLTQLGIDSLMAVELRNAIQRQTGVSVAIGKILDGSSTQHLVEVVLDGLAAGPQPDSKLSDRPAMDALDSARLLEQLPGLSDADVDGLLARLLASGSSAA